MANLILHGRCVVPGSACGQALVVRGSLGGWGAIDPLTGTFADPWDGELYGKSFAGKILVFAGAKGSSGWSMCFHTARLGGVGPAAMLFNTVSAKAALGAVVTRSPAVAEFDCDITAAINNGDWVTVTAEHGTVEILLQPQKS